MSEETLTQAKNSWRLITPFNGHFYLSNDVICYFREYVRNGKKKYNTNILIFAFKGNNEMKKAQSAKQFVEELKLLYLHKYIKEGDILIPMPSSKAETDEANDNRMERLLNYFKNLYKPKIMVDKPIVKTKTTQACHQSNVSRNPKVLKETLKWNGFKRTITNKDRIFIVDDILTSGGHFKACKNLILTHHPDVKVRGIMWARTVPEDYYKIRKEIPPK